jgi:putative PIN family toxin of toxin-antitoxin system
MRKVFVIDTNALVSAALIANSMNAKALNRVFVTGLIALSEPVFLEFMEVLYRSKFDKYLTEEKRSQIIGRVEQHSKYFLPLETIIACRDPKDNMFLELAVAANADCIITGDKALLELDPFRNIRILNATRFLELF